MSSYGLVANTGRCGSKTLSNLLSSTPDSTSLHEPRPSFFGEILHSYNNELYLDKFLNEFYSKKIPTILWSVKGKSAYIETSHSFIMSYSNEAANFFGRRLKLIWLFRNKNDVAFSLYRRHAVEGEEKEKEFMRHWLLDPQAMRNLLKASAEKCASDAFSHPFYKYIWYCYESDARTLNFSKNHPEIKIALLPIEYLSNVKEKEKLFSDLDLGEPVGLQKAIGQKYSVSFKSSHQPLTIDQTGLLAFHKLCQEEIVRLDLGDNDLYRKATIMMAGQKSVHLG